MTLRPTPLKRRTRLKAYKGLNQVSPKRLQELRGELPVRLTLIKRCGGIPVYKDYSVVCRGQREPIRTVLCVGGTCEICDKPAGRGEILELHEEPFRSQGGKVSLKDSKMAHRVCHNKEHGIKVVGSKPLWSKGHRQGG